MRRRLEGVSAVRKTESRRQPDGSQWPDLLSTPELCAYLNITERAAARLRDERRLPYLKWGRDCRYVRVEVDAFIARSRVEAIT
jgi:excisionase family DNA binding protein